MEIGNCEFCNAYVPNFEVHTCRIFGNQHRQCSATLPRSSSGNIAQDIDLKTEQIHYEERIPSMNQESSSWHHSILSNIHQRTDCEATAAAEESSQYGVANQNPHIPEISDFLFPGIVHDEEYQTESAYSLQPTEANRAIINPNPQFCEPWNPYPDVNAALPVAEPCFLPGFQQTFGQRIALMNQMYQHPNASCQMEGSGMSCINEMSPHFIYDFNESNNASSNQISQYYETSLEIPTLTIQNAQYNPLEPIPQTDSISPIQSIRCPDELQQKDHVEPPVLLVMLQHRIPATIVTKLFRPDIT
ncbi:hypothetical protein CDAR_609201 [Caerostris darwini]|uniref:Uncharacterized protein n=1 Tax=Caerostris darwini TaxID=1538125 RepID=A0AAV4W892_9ARAC|nr:hypothetical protein CDAR_609201 [Caerostris darwini]